MCLCHQARSPLVESHSPNLVTRSDPIVITATLQSLAWNRPDHVMDDTGYVYSTKHKHTTLSLCPLQPTLRSQIPFSLSPRANPIKLNFLQAQKIPSKVAIFLHKTFINM